MTKASRDIEKWYSAKVNPIDVVEDKLPTYNEAWADVATSEQRIKDLLANASEEQVPALIGLKNEIEQHKMKVALAYNAVIPDGEGNLVNRATGEIMTAKAERYCNARD